MSYHSFQSKRGRSSLSKFNERNQAICIRVLRGQSFKEVAECYGIKPEACGVIFRKAYRSYFPNDTMRINLKRLRQQADELVVKILKS